jgi:hypothetical protein
MKGDDGEDDLADKPLAVAPEANVTESEESEESEENETIDEQSLESVLEEEAGDDEELESGI